MEKPVFGTSLSYSAEHDVLVAGRPQSRDRAERRAQRHAPSAAADGKLLWDNKSSTAGRPCCGKDKILTNGSGGCSPARITDGRAPTGWSSGLTRNYGCNTPIGCQHLLTFRSGAAGFFDLLHDGGTGNFGGFRSSCTNNLIVAGGVLNAPDYTRTCTCALSESNVARPGPHARGGDVDVFGAEAPTARPGWASTSALPATAGPTTARSGWSTRASAATRPSSTSRSSRPIARHFDCTPRRFMLRSFPWVAASGLRGVTRVTLPAEKDKQYTVRLHFLEPNDVAAGERIVNVSIQGRPVLDGLDIIREAGAGGKAW